MINPVAIPSRVDTEKALGQIENLCLRVTAHGITGAAVAQMLLVATELTVSCGTEEPLRERALSLEKVIGSFHAPRGVERRQGWAMKVRHVILLECHAMRLLLKTGISPSHRPDWH